MIGATVKAASERSGIPETLIRSVIRAIGGSDARETLRDVVGHGADFGVPGFTYTRDCVEFFKRHRKAIAQLVTAMACDLGESPINMVAGFNCLRDYDRTELEISIGRCLYGAPVRRDNDSIDDMVANALAWFALEETARAIIEGE